MAGSRSLGSLTLDLILKTGMFQQGLDKAARASEARAKQIAKAAGTIGTAFAGVATVVGGVAISWTKDIASLGIELEKMSKLSKTSTQDFQRLSFGASTVGISQEKLADQFKDFNEKVGEFQATGGGGMKEFFEQIAPKIGITADAFKNLSGPDALQLYFNSLQKANLSHEEMSFYLESMASDTTALIPLLRDGGAGFKTFGDEAERFGTILSQDTIRAIEETRKTSARLDQIMLGLKVSVGEQLLPAFNSFAELLGDQQTQDAIRAVGTLLGTGASKAADFAAEIRDATSAYTDWLREAGRLPAGMLDTEQQLGERIKGLQKIANPGDDPWRNIQNYLFGDKAQAELRATVDELNRLPWRNVSSTVKSTYDGTLSSGRRPKGNGGGGGKPKEMPNFRGTLDELRKMMEIEENARRQFDALSATLAGPLAAANYQYKIDLQEIQDLVTKGGIAQDEATVTIENLTKAHEENVAAIQAQRTPAEEYLDTLREETAWLSANEEGQRRLTAMRYLGVDATESQIQAATEMMRVNEQLHESMRNWEELNRSISGGLYDVISGASSAGDAIQGFMERLNSQILENITDGWADSITDFLKNFGKSGSSGATASGGGFWANVMGALGFADGGYTGPGGKYDAAGIVHAGEFVVQADAVKKIGLPFLEALNGVKNMPGFARGGYVDAWAMNERGTEVRGRALGLTQHKESL